MQCTRMKKGKVKLEAARDTMYPESNLGKLNVFASKPTFIE